MTKQDTQKLKAAGFTFIRADKINNTIKTQSNKGSFSHGWKTLEKGFTSFAAVRKRMEEILKDKKTIEL